MKSLKSLQTIAADWHQNEGPLYNYALTGIAMPGLPVLTISNYPSNMGLKIAFTSRPPISAIGA